MSWANPKLLPIWEAQFGDFHNTAQSVIDTFLVGSQGESAQHYCSEIRLIVQRNG